MGVTSVLFGPRLGTDACFDGRAAFSCVARKGLRDALSGFEWID
jgi:hypothetical protein